MAWIFIFQIQGLSRISMTSANPGYTVNKVILGEMWVKKKGQRSSTPPSDVCVQYVSNPTGLRVMLLKPDC